MAHTGNSHCKAVALNKPTSGNCKCVTFNSGKRNETAVWRCDNRKLRAHNRGQCRKGKAKSFKQRQFVKCPVTRSRRR